MSVVERVLVFVFDPASPSLGPRVREILDEGRLPIVVALGSRGVGGLPDGVVGRHITDPRYCRDDSRAAAASWLHRCVAAAPVAVSGRSLLETGSYAGTPIWWFVHLRLQERAFGLVRLIESVSRAARGEGASAYCVVDEDPRPNGGRAVVVRRACERLGLEELRAGAGAGRFHGGASPPLDGEPTVAGWRRPRQPARGPVLLDQVRFPLTPRGVSLRLVSAALVTLSWAWRLAAAVVVTLFSALALPLLIARRRLEFELRPGRLLATSLAAVAYLVYASLRFLGSVFSAVLRGSGEAVRFRGRPRGGAFAVARLASRVLEAVRDALGIGAGARPVILCVVDAGGLKRRLDLRRARRSVYDPYFEDVVRRLRRAGRAQGYDVLALEYGTRGGPAASRLKRAALELGRLLRRNTVSVVDLLSSESWAEAERWQASGQDLWRALREDAVFQAAVEYRGVALWDLLAPDVDLALRSLGHAVLYVHAVRAFNRGRAGSKLLVLYSFEGQFRPFCAGAVAEGVPTVGVQFALGPNVHGLNQAELGYRRRAGGPALGCPIPDRIAAWSPFYRELFSGPYGYPDGLVEVLGYPRLDTFVRERSALTREATLRRLGLRGIGRRGVMYTGVLRTRDADVTLEEEFVATLRALVAVSDRHADVFVLVKPWVGDDLERIETLCLAHGNARTVYVAPALEVHNVDLFRLSDVMVGTLSSTFAEALVMGNACVLMDYPSCRAIFGDLHTELFRPLADTVRSPDEVEPVVEAALARPSRPLDERPEVREGLERVFGPVDGRSADRLVEFVLTEADRARAR